MINTMSAFCDLDFVIMSQQQNADIVLTMVLHPASDVASYSPSSCNQSVDNTTALHQSPHSSQSCILSEEKSVLNLLEGSLHGM